MTQPKTASKFTPGPWEADGLRVKSQQGIVAKAFVPQERGCFAAMDNARLIAAAPEMYELLDKLADRTRGVDAVLDIGRSEWADLCQDARRLKAEIDGE